MSSQVNSRLCASDECGRTLFGPVSFCPYCGRKQQIPQDQGKLRESELETSHTAILVTTPQPDFDAVSTTLKPVSKAASDIEYNGNSGPQLVPSTAFESPAAITPATPDSNPKPVLGKAVAALLVIGAVALVWTVFTPSVHGPDQVASASKSKAAAGSKSIMKPADESTFNARKNLVENALNHSATGDISAMDRALQALAEYSKYERGDRSRARGLNKEGLELLTEKRHTEAAIRLREAITADPRDEEIRNNLGFALIYVADFDGAQRALVDTLTIAPKRANAWMNLGMLYAKRSLESKAVGAYIMAHRFSTAPEKAIISLVNMASDPQETNQVVKESARKALEKITGKELATLLSEGDSNLPSARPGQSVPPKKVLHADIPNRQPVPTTASVQSPVSDESNSPSAARQAFERARESAKSPEPAPAQDGQILALIKQAEASLARKQYGRARAIAESVLMLDRTNANASVLQQRAKDAEENALRGIKIE